MYRVTSGILFLESETLGDAMNILVGETEEYWRGVRGGLFYFAAPCGRFELRFSPDRSQEREGAIVLGYIHWKEI